MEGAGSFGAAAPVPAGAERRRIRGHGAGRAAGRRGSESDRGDAEAAVGGPPRNPRAGCHWCCSARQVRTWPPVKSSGFRPPARWSPRRPGGLRLRPQGPGRPDVAAGPEGRRALERLGEPLTVPQLSRHAGMSERSFMRRFAEETGTTPLQWLMRARMGLARELLEATDHSVDVVARESGLGSAANLRLHFRRTLNTTPTAYRRAFSRRVPPART
ncbi:helix-turn-helix domain-containing protein [Streptomyces sp. TLI_55]|uniref:helix-turn-helix domain-containing protein n=1 Tax=Streptomyces sp. TLI_55 TaxID=1938861 RepID=UPI00359C1730